MLNCVIKTIHFTLHVYTHYLAMLRDTELGQDMVISHSFQQKLTQESRPKTKTIICLKQEAQLMLTNPRDTFSGQSRSPNIVPFHMLGRVPLL